MAGYIGPAPVPQATQNREAFTATSGQTSFATAGYTPQFIDVYLNGVKLAAADYTATNGSDVVLASGAASGDILEVVAFSAFTVADQAFTGTTTAANLTVTGNATFADNGKAIFGAGSDLEVFHDGSASNIIDTGTGNLFICGSGAIHFMNPAQTEYYASFNDNGAVDLRYDNSIKLATESGGVNITGVLTSDGLTVQATGANYPLIEHSSGNRIQLQPSYNYYNSFQHTFKNLDGSANTLTVGQTGDISFYEDTGTTPKFFWDASAESLGIGTSPSYTFDVSAANAVGMIRTPDTTPPTLGLFVNSGSNGVGTISVDNGGHMTFDTGSSGAGQAERMRLTAAGKIGIGTDAPQGTVVVQASDAKLGVDNNGSKHLEMGIGSGGCSFMMTTGHTMSFGHQPYANRGSDSNFSEAIRLDSSGNLLVGATSTGAASGGSGTSGININASGAIEVARSGNPVMFVNRTTSDGDIMQFRKDGASVGVVGVSGSNSFVGTGDTGLHFAADLDVLNPWNTSTNSVRDAAISLGWASGRYKDLYLSGGVYLGGTGSANKLDDYESGTWTPAIEGSSVAGTGTYGFQNGTYVKVGKVVTLNFDYQLSNHTGSGDMSIVGLPFPSASTSGRESTGSCMTNNFNFSGTPVNVTLYISGSSSYMRLYISQDNAGWLQQSLDVSHNLIGSITYITD